MKLEITTAVKKHKRSGEEPFEGILIVRDHSSPKPEPGTPEDKFINWLCSQLLAESYVGAPFVDGTLLYTFPLQLSLPASTPEMASALVETEKARIYTLIEKGLPLYCKKRESWVQSMWIEYLY